MTNEIFADKENSVNVQIVSENAKDIPMKILPSTPEAESLLAKGSNGEPR